MGPEIKSRLDSGNSSHHSVQNCLSSGLMLKNVQIGMPKESRSIKLKEHTLTEFQDKVIIKIQK
jgi:hypothetical protein